MKQLRLLGELRDVVAQTVPYWVRFPCEGQKERLVFTKVAFADFKWSKNKMHPPMQYSFGGDFERK